MVCQKLKGKQANHFISIIDRYIHCYLPINNSREKLNHITTSFEPTLEYAYIYLGQIRSINNLRYMKRGDIPSKLLSLTGHNISATDSVKFFKRSKSNLLLTIFRSHNLNCMVLPQHHRFTTAALPYGDTL